MRENINAELYGGQHGFATSHHEAEEGRRRKSPRREVGEGGRMEWGSSGQTHQTQDISSRGEQESGDAHAKDDREEQRLQRNLCSLGLATAFIRSGYSTGSWAETDQRVMNLDNTVHNFPSLSIFFTARVANCTLIRFLRVEGRKKEKEKKKREIERRRVQKTIQEANKSRENRPARLWLIRAVVVPRTAPNMLKET